VVDSFGDVASDVTSLAELQFQLLAVDIAESKKQLTIPLVLLLGGLVILFGAGAVSLLTVAACLHEFAELSISASLGIVALGGIVISSCVLAVALLGLRKSVTCFERSRSEWKENVEWLKQLKNRNR
jgi:uncharacterized membrane protein YqjE